MAFPFWFRLLAATLLAQRWIRTVKRECICRCIFLTANGLRRVLTEWVRH